MPTPRWTVIPHRTYPDMYVTLCADGTAIKNFHKREAKNIGAAFQLYLAKQAHNA